MRLQGLATPESLLRVVVAFIVGVKRDDLTERFTRIAAGEIRYEITLDDPDTWIRPWTVMLRLTHTDDQLYESACHEGNAAIMKTILSGN